jgi:hypothetical protein
MNTSELKKTVQNKRLLTKKDFIEKIIEPHNKKDLSKMKISELRELYKMTHIIDGNFRDMRGYCFSCLTPLKPDYTRFENYCLDC